MVFKSRRKEMPFVSVAEALGIMIQFGSLMISIITLVLIISKQNKKNNRL